MDNITIARALAEDVNALARLACALWPAHSLTEMRQEMGALIARKEAACFLAWDGKEAVGFAQCQLRHDYVEGTDTSPVGYLEGIYVAESYRRRGIARALLGACEDWAREMGCAEFASDCELENETSFIFHRKVGFAEVGRIICFSKPLL